MDGGRVQEMEASLLKKWYSRRPIVKVAVLPSPKGNVVNALAEVGHYGLCVALHSRDGVCSTRQASRAAHRLQEVR